MAGSHPNRGRTRPRAFHLSCSRQTPRTQPALVGSGWRKVPGVLAPPGDMARVPVSKPGHGKAQAGAPHEMEAPEDLAVSSSPARPQRPPSRTGTESIPRTTTSWGEDTPHREAA